MQKAAKFLCLVAVMAFAVMIDASAAYRIPESQIAPQTSLGYEYVPGYERNLEVASEPQKYDIRFSYIYGTTITFDAGSAPEYTLNVTRSTTEEAKLDFNDTNDNIAGIQDLKLIEEKLADSIGYKLTGTATIYKGEYGCKFTEPGRYDLSWYMRGHRYIAQCGAKVISTGSDHGQFSYYTLGTITYPTSETAFDISRVD